MFQISEAQLHRQQSSNATSAEHRSESLLVRERAEFKIVKVFIPTEEGRGGQGESKQQPSVSRCLLKTPETQTGVTHSQIGESKSTDYKN